MPQASPKMGSTWPELSRAKSHRLILLPQMEIDISIHQNNNLNIKKKIVFRVKTFLNFTHQMCIEKDVKPGKKNVIYFVSVKETQPGCQPSQLQVTAMADCFWIQRFLSVCLLVVFIRYTFLELHCLICIINDSEAVVLKIVTPSAF